MIDQPTSHISHVIDQPTNQLHQSPDRSNNQSPDQSTIQFLRMPLLTQLQTSLQSTSRPTDHSTNINAAADTPSTNQSSNRSLNLNQRSNPSCQPYAHQPPWRPLTPQLHQRSFPRLAARQRKKGRSSPQRWPWFRPTLPRLNSGQHSERAATAPKPPAHRTLPVYVPCTGRDEGRGVRES